MFQSWQMSTEDNRDCLYRWYIYAIRTMSMDKTVIGNEREKSLKVGEWKTTGDKLDEMQLGLCET